MASWAGERPCLVLGLVGGVRALGAAARPIYSPRAGGRSGAGRGRFELSLMGFGAGLRGGRPMRKPSASVERHTSKPGAGSTCEGPALSRGARSLNN